MESLTGKTQHMHTIYHVKPTYQPKKEKRAYLWHFSADMVEIFYGVSKLKDSTYICDLCAFEYANWPNQPTTQPAQK